MLITPIITSRIEESGPGVRMSQALSCPRQIAYSASAFPITNRPNARRMRTLAHGTAIHGFLRAEIAAGLWQGVEPVDVPTRDEDEVELTYETQGTIITGHPDGVVDVTQGGEIHRAVLEVKSTNGFGFRMRKAEGPSPEHVAQGSMYARQLSLEWVFVVYYNKDQDNVMCFLEALDTDLVLRAMNGWRDALDAAQQMEGGKLEWDDDRLPDRAYQPDNKGTLPWQCGYCRYVSGCWEGAELIGSEDKPKYRSVEHR